MGRTINEKIASDIQKLAYGIHVDLFDIDTSPTGDTGGPYYICSSITTSGTPVKLNGVTYTPINYEFEGYGMSGDDKLARPTFSVSNVTRTFAALVNEYDGLVGTLITRRRTRSEYLDDGEEADAAAQMPTEIYVIDKIVDYNKLYIKWQLKAPVDDEDTKLPGTQAWKDFCPFTYRIYVDGSFDYSHVYECPYTGSNYFKRDGTSTTNPSEDVCGKRLSDCRLRYTTGVIPFGGFPGMAEVRLGR